MLYHLTDFRNLNDKHWACASLFTFSETHLACPTRPRSLLVVHNWHRSHLYPLNHSCDLWASAILFTAALSPLPDLFLSRSKSCVHICPMCFLQHGVLLSTGSIFCAYCSYLSTLAANGIERYVYHATPEQFRLASTWYYWKLMYCSVRSDRLLQNSDV